MSNGSNWDRKSQLSGILTEPFNPRVQTRDDPRYSSSSIYLHITPSLHMFIKEMMEGELIF